LAILLEASAHKPGNVNVVTDFEKTRYEHFLASAVAVAPSLEYGARRGIAVSEGRINVAEVGVGKIIKDCVVETASWQHGGNTLLGTAILLSPMAVAAGMCYEDASIAVDGLRKNLKIVTSSTTPKDAVDVYDAIEIANSISVTVIEAAYKDLIEYGVVPPGVTTGTCWQTFDRFNRLGDFRS
jgi:triphosphoribosyl-dephospho-CoA synthase